MIKIIEHGYKRYYANCDKCKCYFSYDINDLDDKGQISCPDCGCKVPHFSNNYDMTSQIKELKGEQK